MEVLKMENEIKITIDIKIEGLDEVKKEKKTGHRNHCDYNPTKSFKLWDKPVTKHTNDLLDTVSLYGNICLLSDGAVTVNQIYKMLGLKPIKNGDKWGWKLDDIHPDEKPIKLRLVPTGKNLVIDFKVRPYKL